MKEIELKINTDLTEWFDGKYSVTLENGAKDKLTLILFKEGLRITSIQGDIDYFSNHSKNIKVILDWIIHKEKIEAYREAKSDIKKKINNLLDR